MSEHSSGVKIKDLEKGKVRANPCTTAKHEGLCGTEESMNTGSMTNGSRKRPIIDEKN